MPISHRCRAHNCKKPVVAKNLCGTHYKRFQRHGDFKKGSRPVDWGKREEHPLYQTWCSLRRYYGTNIVKIWRDDFWIFVRDIGDKPTDQQVKLTRPDESKAFGPKNWYWEIVVSALTDDQKKLNRDRAKANRKAHPDYYRDKDLQRYYGVTLEWYNQTLKDQKGKCAICKQPETLQINDRVVRLAVDHHHGKGHPRGLLCAKCNRGLGFFKDDPNLMIQAAEYIKSYSF